MKTEFCKIENQFRIKIKNCKINKDEEDSGNWFILDSSRSGDMEMEANIIKICFFFYFYFHWLLMFFSSILFAISLSPRRDLGLHFKFLLFFFCLVLNFLLILRIRWMEEWQIEFLCSFALDVNDDGETEKNE
jgi:hypothetical protein